MTIEKAFEARENEAIRYYDTESQEAANATERLNSISRERG